MLKWLDHFSRNVYLNRQYPKPTVRFWGLVGSWPVWPCGNWVDREDMRKKRMNGCGLTVFQFCIPKIKYSLFTISPVLVIFSCGTHLTRNGRFILLGWFLRLSEQDEIKAWMTFFKSTTGKNNLIFNIFLNCRKWSLFPLHFRGQVTVRITLSPVASRLCAGRQENRRLPRSSGIKVSP